mmetsp:Transcript_59229/g.157666  ORF Transcript_59229/g.157666 Transcript_59229/m.157666 type:complete len:171 (-) Transcript_59229:131-643(-)|eukprot:CAMPEP_0194503348 /NCGR_PEP_ID=MMETSP0253-20130528/28332_1 /TAXON_ID=2966 /ORGANISM="Noctiluca scintillans" /LENGTH=170 /DNA_ID=CAMNT_0039345625 /DNA_START=72 /DNA_END=584 /DNA_ORIENTATION=+
MANRSQFRSVSLFVPIVTLCLQLRVHARKDLYNRTNLQSCDEITRETAEKMRHGLHDGGPQAILFSKAMLPAGVGVSSFEAAKQFQKPKRVQDVAKAAREAAADRPRNSCRSVMQGFVGLAALWGFGGMIRQSLKDLRGLVGIWSAVPAVVAVKQLLLLEQDGGISAFRS